ncbi:MAG: Na+/H+ antiporter NhaC, partial [Anaerovorax sp.]|nr:Na+/H+ antiporter NhaC [Anaerovorax sp.]
MDKKSKRQPRPARLHEALFSFVMLIIVMAVGIMVFEVAPHIPMFIGVIVAAIVALYIGYDWKDIEQSMIEGISRAMQAIIILAIIGMLIGVWLLAGVVPSMIYYGLKILSPQIFLVAAVLICSITSLATGTSWGTMGTMGIALMGIANGLGIPPGIAAGAIISGAYFGDKMSPLSDTTNLAPAMAGTDVFTHIKFMMKPTIVTYTITLIFFGVMGMKFSTSGSAADISAIDTLINGLDSAFHISPLLLLPPVIVIGAIAMKVPAIPGITLGIIAGAIMAPIFQGSSADFGAILTVARDGYVSETGIEALDSLLSAGGLMNMMSSIALTLLAMMFGGIMEMTKQLEVIVDKLLKLVHSAFGLVALVLGTCVLSNATMPEQYIAIVLPGRMYAQAFKEKGLHPKTLSNALESSGTVTSALIPWNTCGVYITTVLGVTTS